ncbi:uncharacterized protein DFL_008638 [Arthrobotrys flagrans]|uniref:Uncharacterized protein n=1 Tax=Arthrobotrys flagrans TaxID=97331 RepID=A0A436ZPD2_ARTFL|nr:hypothetical protein DFL_008638 [Arthrobotrys flagrans]
MVIRAEAQSLDTLTRLADNPPLQIRRYPPQPPPHDPHAVSSHQLKLYIVRVPNSQDIILTPLKPQCNTVTAQDIVSCLYYLRIQPLEGLQKPRSQSLQPDHYSARGTSSFDDARPSYLRASFSGESSRSDHLFPGGQNNNDNNGGYLNHSSSSIHSVGSGPMPTSTDFEITFIRRDRTTGSQATIGRIYSNHNSPLVDIPHMPNSYAAQMMHQESLVSKKGRRDRKRLNLEVYTDGYRKFVCNQKPVGTPVTLNVPDTTRPSTATSDGGDSVSSGGGYLWPAPVPPPPPGFEDVGPPPPPKDLSRPQMMNPAMSRVSYQSRFTEIYSPDSPNPSIRRPRPQQQPETPAAEIPEPDDDSDGIFKRTLFLQGEGFWKSTGKRLSVFSAAHRRKRSDSPGSYNRHHQQQPSQPRYAVDEETRIAMEQMGLYSTSPNYCPSDGGSPDEKLDRETKGKGYVFEPPQKGTGTCEFETNGVGRKIRLRLHPPSTIAGSPFGNTTIVKGDPILLSTLSLRPPDADGNPPPSGSSSRPGHSRGLSKFKFGEKFKKLQRENSWTEQTEYDAGSGLKSKLGSLLVEGEGMDVLDLVVVSSMGVFYRRYCEWAEDLKEGGGI